MIRLRSQLLILCLLACPTFALAQEQTRPTPEKEQPGEVEAFEMLESIAEGIPALRSSDNRIFLTAAVADLLWARNEKRARSMFESLAGEVSSTIASLDPSEQRSHNMMSMIQQQRREIVERMARRDPEMALTFLRATRPPVALRPAANDYASESNLELHLAGLIASKNPEQALRVARANLKKGVTYQVISVLTQFGSKNASAAQTLHSEIVDKLKASNLSTDHEAANAAWNLLGSFQPPQSTEDAHRSLLELMANAVLAIPPDARSSNSLAQNSVHQVPAYMAQFEKYAPARATALKQWSQQIKLTVDPGSTMYQELSDITQKGTVDDLLALTGKYGREHHQQIYQYAVSKAISSGDANRARQIIFDFVPEGLQRTQMLEQLNNQLFWAAVNENKLSDARQTLDRLTNVDQRFNLLMSLANNFIARGEKDQAGNVLAEARTLLDRFPANASKLGAQLHLAQCYSTVDPRQSMALLQSVIGIANQLIAAAVVLDGFENSYLKDGEWLKRGHTGLSTLVNNIEQNLGALARSDLDGARSLSKQLERPEIRMMAQLEIARTLLTSGNGSINFSRVFTHYPSRRHRN